MLKPSKFVFSKVWHLDIDFGQIEYAVQIWKIKNFRKFCKNPQNMQIRLKYL